MGLRVPRRAIPFVAFALVVFALYGYGVELVIGAVESGAGQGQLLLMAVAIAATIAGLCFAFSWLILARQRRTLRSIERQFGAKTRSALPTRG